MVSRIVETMLKARKLKGWLQPAEIQLRNRELEVDYILRRQARHGSGADVIDPQREIAEVVPQRLTKQLDVLSVLLLLLTTTGLGGRRSRGAALDRYLQSSRTAAQAG